MDKCTRCQVLWVGLSAKKATCDDETPLSRNTNSGAIIHKIEESLVGVSTYKTYLVNEANGERIYASVHRFSDSSKTSFQKDLAR